MQLTAVNGTAYTKEKLEDAIKHAETDKAALRLLFKREDRYQTIDLDYHGGLRYPRLERVEGTRDLLDEILSPSK
jgi:hypothetical protein